MALTCPKPERLDALLRGELSEADRLACEQHMESCVVCQRLLEELSSSDLQGTPRPDPESHEPLLDEVINKLQQAGPKSEAAPVSDPLFKPGTKFQYFGDYEIIEELGRGGMGVVYRARQVSLNRPVALKVILAGQLASSSEVRRFRNEAEAAARLDHPNIVPIYEIGEHEGRHYFSMKFVEGASLAMRLRDLRMQKATRDLAQMFAQVARAVHYAHQRSILHRDLKPANIVLDDKGQPHLTDFGVAKIIGSNDGLTRTQAIMGTPDYISPEVASGRSKEVTTAADVFSLGAILYELLTGCPPFHEESTAATLQNVLNVEPRRPQALEPTVPRDLETIALRCLEKDPTHRYSSAAEVADELERFARGETILARPANVPERVWRWARRKPVLASLVVALHVVFVIGLAGVMWQWWRAEAHVKNEARLRKIAESGMVRAELDEAETLLDTERTARGLAQLARLARRTSTNQIVTERLLSALNSRAFCLPIAPLAHDAALNSPKSAEFPAWFPFMFEGAVVSVNFSRDGSKLVTAGKDGTARIWDALTGKALTPPLRHAAEVVWANFDSNALRVVTASLDGTARIWDAHSGQSLSPPLRHKDAVWFAEFSPDTHSVLTASEDQTAQLWDARTGKPQAEPLRHRHPVYFAIFSPDGTRIMTGERLGLASLWDRLSGEFLGSINQPSRREISRSWPQFSPSGDVIAAFRGRRVGLWSSQGEPLDRSWLNPDGQMDALEFSHNGRWLATACRDGTVCVLQSLLAAPVVSKIQQQQTVTSLQFSDDDTELLTGSRDQTARLWDIETGQMITEPIHQGDPVLSARLGLGGRRIATISGTEGAWLWSVQSAADQPTVCRTGKRIAFAHFDREGKRVAIIGQETLKLFDAATGVCAGDMFQKLPQRVQDADFAPDGRLVTATEMGNTVLWDTNGESLGPPLRDADWSPSPLSRSHTVEFGAGDGHLVVTSSEDNMARIWNTQTRKFLPLAHSSRVTCARFSPDGTLVVTASADRTARIWKSGTGEPVLPALRHEREVDWVDFDPSGQMVATASKDKCVRLWSVKTGKLLTPPLRHATHLSERNSFDFSPQGGLLATMSGAALQVWRTDTGEAVTGSIKLEGRLNSICFSPSGKRLVVACQDGFARIFDPLTGHQICEPLRHSDSVSYAEFSPDGSRVLTCSWDGTAKIWGVHDAPIPIPSWLPELAEALAGERMEEQNFGSPVSVETLYRLCQKLISEPATDYYNRWAHQFLEDRSSQSVRPATSKE